MSTFINLFTNWDADCVWINRNRWSDGRVLGCGVAGSILAVLVIRTFGIGLVWLLLEGTFWIGLLGWIEHGLLVVIGLIGSFAGNLILC